MNRIIIIIPFFVSLFFTQIGYVEDSFPTNHIKHVKVIRKSESFNSLSVFKQKFKEAELNYSSWSTISHSTLDSLKIDVDVSSHLGTDYYGGRNLTDGKNETAWVEGIKGNGIGEWARIHLLAKKESVTTTPFGVSAVGIIAGYGKNQKTWLENNRVKSLLLVIETPHVYDHTGETMWQSYKFDIQDKNELQMFNLPPNDYVDNELPMESIIWVKILEVYKGNKYDDTCISEIVVVGGSTS